jgi:hypothetical protein
VDQAQRKKGDLRAALRLPTRADQALAPQIQALGGRMTVLLHHFLVPTDLSVQFVHQLVDRGIEIFMGLFAEQIAALHMQRDLGALPPLLLLLLFHGEQDVDVNDLVKVASHPIELGHHVFTQCRRHFKMMAADRQVHRASFPRLGNKKATAPGSWTMVALACYRHFQRGIPA